MSATKHIPARVLSITTKPLVQMDIKNAPGLDPIRVIVDDLEPGRGRITVSCYDMAWVGYWGAMGGRTLRDFFMDCGSDYLAGNMGCGSGLKQGARDRTYLIRVIEAVQRAFREQATGGPS